MKLTFIYFFSSFAIVISSVPAFALIPTSKTILSRATHQRGKGAYVVEQDVTIKTEGEPITLREKWTVVNAEVMRLSVSRKGATDVRLESVYRSGKKTLVDTQGTPKVTPESSEFIEPYFYFRTSGSFQLALVRANILPKDFGREQRKIVPTNANDKSESATLMSINEPYVRLSRSGGVVDYALGKVVDGENGTGVWIEQDLFNLRRIKFPSQAEVEAERYLTYAEKFKFPKERTVKWGNYTANIRVVSVRPATDQEAAKNLSLASGEETASRVPEIAGLKEFYSRFR